MNKQAITPYLTLSVLLAALPSGAQDVSATKAESPNRMSLSYRMAFNVAADFRTTLGAGVSLPEPGVSGVDRNYDDGYNRVDGTGNAGGYTRYWGYDYDDQYDAVNHTITMHRASGSSVANDRNDGLQPGFELTYARELGRRGKCRWGVETAINYMNVRIRDKQPAGISGTFITDTYQLPPLPGGGYVIPPPAPYEGPYDPTGIGNPAIYDTPSNRVTSDLSAVSGSIRDFSADVIGWRLGPCVEFPVVTNVSFSLSGGFSLVGVISDYRFNETVTGTADGNVTQIRGSGSHGGVLPGGHVAGTFHIRLEKGWTAFAGAQFQGAGRYIHREGASRARLDLGKSIFVSIGASYSF
jgi:hypothetical protein